MDDRQCSINSRRCQNIYYVNPLSVLLLYATPLSGIALTKEGVEFLGYARQVIQEMSLLEDRFVSNKPQKQRFRIINIILALTLGECIWGMLH